MNAWHDRLNITEDWISLLFLFNFILFVILNNRYKNNSRGFINELIAGRRRLLFKNDSKRGAHRLFEIGAFIAIGSGFYLLIHFLLESEKTIVLDATDQIYIFVTILIVFILRYIVVSTIVKLLNKSEEIKVLVFKNYTNTYLFCIVTLFFLLFYYFVSPPTFILFGFSFFILGFWMITQIYKYYQYLKNNIKDVLYLIFYLCTMKFAPWLWVYKFVVETRL